MRWRIYYGDPGGMVYDGDCVVTAVTQNILDQVAVENYVGDLFCNS